MTPIAAPLIPAHWARIWKLIEPAVTRGSEHTERSVLAGLLHGGFVLWSDVPDIDQAQAFVVTSWCDYPAGRIGFVSFAGGAYASLWVEQAIADFRAWSQMLGCKELRVIGRMGWARLLKRGATDFIFRETI